MLTIVDHPLIQHKLSILRDKYTPTVLYRQVTREIAILLGYRLFETLPLISKSLRTPMEAMNASCLGDDDPCIVSILRAGNGFLEGLIDLLPQAKIGFVGIQRNPETHLPEDYYCNLPKGLDKRYVFLVDPMLATGGSAIDALNKLKEQGAKHIRFLCLIAAPEGVVVLQAAHPDVDIITAAVDRQLNENKYILPGLGDAGDRYYGTSAHPV